MSNTDDIDKFGHCVICHKNLITKRVVDGKVEDMFLPEYGHTFFLLEDGSQMQVTMCKPCQSQNELTDPEVHKNVMDAVIKGWTLEQKFNSNQNISKNDASNYLNKFSRDSIDIHVGSIDKNILIERSQILSKEFNAKLTESRIIKDSIEVTVLGVSK